jgi:Flp pilus assembly protein TadG
MAGFRRDTRVSGVARAIRRALIRFRQDTSGTLVIFGLMLFVLMIMMGGIAVDLMRYETTRTNLQNTLDRSTLAAATLSQALPPESVVNDYFLKAGLMNYLSGVVVDEGMNYRTVTADANADTQPFFMQLLGVNDLLAKGHSQAEQRLNNVEIMLALDISGSMQGTKVANLITAANSFIDTVLNSDPDQKISIGIVPYNAQVNLPPELMAEFNVVHQNDVVNDNCLELPASVFTTPAIDRGLALSEMAYADTLSSTSQSTSYVSVANGAPAFGNAYCLKGTYNQILLPTKTASVLHAKINGLIAGGYTSIMYGMRWGLEFLDPSTQSIFSDLIAGGYMSANLSGHPAAYDDAETLKVVVLMSDGENTLHEQIRDDHKDGPSPIYKSVGDGYYSIQHTTGLPAAAGTNTYWAPHLCVSSSCTSGTNTAEAWLAAPYNSGAGVVQLDWKDVWAKFRDSYVAWQFYARALGTSSSTRTTAYNNAISSIEMSYGPTTTEDSQLQQVCAQAKANGVVVFTIGFQAPSIGLTQLKACATSAAHFFDATTLTIGTAFKAIANNISQLRLTQ